MSDLVAFLRARWDAEEAAAKAASEPDGPAWRVDAMYEDSGHAGVSGEKGTVVYDEGAPWTEQAAHIAAWDPARLLREVEAKRRIIIHAQGAEQDVPDIYAYDLAADYVLRALAAVYSDHPEYDPEWTMDG